MTPRTLPTSLVAALAFSCAAAPPVPTAPAAPAAPAARAAPAAPPAPPVAARKPVESLLHGQRRVDEYAWLRAKGTPEVEAHLQAENRYTDEVLRPTEPLQRKLYDEFLSRIQQTDLTVPYPRHGWLYYARTEEGRQYAIHARKRGAQGAEEVLLDLNALAAGKKYLGLGRMSPSDDDRLLAYTTDETGFRQYDLHVKDLATGRDLPDRAARVDSVAWAADGKTLFYVTEDDAKRPSRLWRHRLGEEAARDALVLEEKDERFTLDVERTRSEAFLVLASRSLTTSEVRVLPAGEPEGTWRVVAPRVQGEEYDLDHRGDRFWIRVNDRGRNFRLVSAPVAEPGRGRWVEAVPHRPEVMLEDVDVFEGHLVLWERREGLQRLVLFRPETGQRVELDSGEPVYDLFPDRNAEYRTGVYRYGLQSLVTPRSVYRWDLSSGALTLLKRVAVPGGYDPARYRQERRWATAADGTRIPVSLVRRADLGKGPHPALLYGYGAYGLPMPDLFDPARLSLLDRGMVYAVAHVRGGGEMGKAWHDGGRMMQKRNTFTDFVACAESLVADGTTAPDRLAIEGGSAGGLLVGAVLNLRPDLFRAAVAEVPFVDVINTMLDESLPLTVGEFEEWGNPKEPAAHAYMASYSPYDNVAARPYPALLVVSSYNDSQVMYWEPAKWVARLRAAWSGDRPLLLRMDLEPAGHGGKSGRYERLRQRAFVDAFLLWQLGLER